jgi:hypothetical protein
MIQSKPAPMALANLGSGKRAARRPRAEPSREANRRRAREEAFDRGF